jgi:uncharacterized protein (TIGR03663 family)
MPVRRLPASDEWQLGLEPREEQEFTLLADTLPKADLSTARLTRPVQVVTVEHLAWCALTIWAIITRLLELSMAPLGAEEARHALFEFDLVNATNWASTAGYHPALGGWVHLVEAGLFAAAGASDFAARLLFAMSGLVIIAAAFLMRPYLGRAGAIAAAGLIAVSPTFTYFSRASTMAIVAAAAAMMTIEMFLALTPRPSLLRAIGAGAASGLLCGAGAAGLATGGILLTAAALLGVYQLIVSDRIFLDLRIRLERYASALAAAIITATLVWFASELSVLKFPDLIKSTHRLWTGFSARDYLAGLQCYVPGMMLYDFFIILIAITGLIAIIYSRTWSPFARFSLLWLAMSFGYFLGSRERDPERLVLMLLPLVIVGALGIDYLHHTKVWPYLRVLLIALSAAAAYVQVQSNFIYVAPDANETSWARHANLYWTEGATTTQARVHLEEIRRRFPEAGGTVFNFGVWQPSLRWYLRDFRPAKSAKLADLVINASPLFTKVQATEIERSDSIELEQSWDPTLTGLTPARALRFVLTGIAWAPLQGNSIAIAVRPRLDSAPTLIIPPSPSR